MIAGIVAGRFATQDYTATPYKLPTARTGVFDWASSASDTNALFTADASWLSTDYIVFVFTTEGITSITPPAGVSLIDKYTHTSVSTLKMFVYGGFKSSATTFAFTFSAGNIFAAAASALSNVDTTTPYDSIWFNSNSGGTTADVVPPVATVTSTTGKYALIANGYDQNVALTPKRGTPVIATGVTGSIGGTTRRTYAGLFPVAEGLTDIVAPRYGCSMSLNAISCLLVLNRASGTRTAPSPAWSAITSYLSGFAMGYAWAAQRNGFMVASGVGGYARSAAESTNPSIPFTLDTLQPVASVTKIITELAIRRLVLTSGVNLNNTAASYMGGGWTYGTNVSSITLRQLLLMTEGISATFNDLAAYPSGLQSWIANTATNPGGLYVYDNGPLSMMQAVIEAVSGVSYVSYVQDNVFAPLGIVGAQSTAPSPETLMYAQGGTTGGSQLVIPSTGWGGWRLSARHLLRLAREFRHPKVLTDAGLQGMLNDRYRMAASFNARAEVHQHDGVQELSTQGFYAVLVRASDGYDIVAVTNTKPTAGIDWTVVRNAISNV